MRIIHLVPVLLAPIAVAQPLVYDGFNYGNLPSIDGAAGGTGWSGPWADFAAGLGTSTSSVGLGYPSLATSPGAAVSAPGMLPDMVSLARPFPAPAGSALYTSFLIRPDPGFSLWYTLRLGLYPAQVDVGAPMGMGQYGLMLGDGVFALSNVPLIEGRTTLLVLEISLGPSSTSYNLYVDPVVGAPKPAFPSAQFARQGAIPFRPGLSVIGEGGFTLDELRLGSTWESVLPAACWANCDGSTTAPVLNVLDFSCFLNRFAAGDAYANCDGSTTPPVLNVLDFTCFLNTFAAGCP